MAKSSYLFLQKTPLQLFERVLNNPQHSLPLLRLASSVFELPLKHMPSGKELHLEVVARRCSAKSCF